MKFTKLKLLETIYHYEKIQIICSGLKLENLNEEYFKFKMGNCKLSRFASTE